MILPGCLAIAPAEGVLTLACAIGRCVPCGALACAAHDRCAGCGHVICQACDTEGGVPVTRFAGDVAPHPHNERGP